ncbi:MAG: formate dehydrogenase accessory protein FdhE, partial [Methylobacterium sp.]
MQPDPDRIGIAGSVPFVQLPVPADLFANRALRLQRLAPDHPMGGYLDLLARIARSGWGSSTACRRSRATAWRRPAPSWPAWT